jgi:CysZ protein
MSANDAVGGPPDPAPADFVVVPPANVEPAAAPRPGALRRFAAGAWHVPGGAIFLLRRPRLWLLAAVPALLGVAGLVAGLILGVYGVRGVETTIGAHRPRLPDLLDLVAVLGLWAGTLASGVLGALAMVLLLSAPLLDWLGRRAESPAATSAPTSAETLRAFRHAFYLLPAVPIAFLLSLIPFAGPPLAGAFIALVLAFQLTAPALARRGRDARAMRLWHGQWRAEVMGFGIAAIVLLPFISPILAPALATGAALLVHEIEGDAPAPIVESTTAG